jgi:hypothetical protein
VPKSARFYLLLIVSIALLLRIGLMIAQPLNEKSIDRLPDQREYLSLAQHLLHHHELSFVDPRFGQTVYAYRMPGYPLFLAACGCSISIAQMAQCLIDTSTVLAVYLITRQLSGGSRASLIAAALMAFNPFYVYFSNLLLSETLFASLLAWGIYFLIHRSRRQIALGAFFLIAAAYVRTTGLLMMPAVVFAVALNNSPVAAYPLSKRRRLCPRLWCLGYCVPTTLLFSSVLVLCMYPWADRNHNRLGSWIWTTTNDGVTLYDGFHPGATGASDQRFVTEMPALMSMNEVQRSRFLADSARRWVETHWMQTPALTLRKILRGWSPVPLSQDFGRRMYRIISAAYSVPFDLLCLAGLFSPRLPRRTKLLLAMPAMVVTLGQALTVGSIRYRMPAEAPLAALAVAGMVDVLTTAKIRMTKIE